MLYILLGYTTYTYLYHKYFHEHFSHKESVRQIFIYNGGLLTEIEINEINKLYDPTLLHNIKLHLLFSLFYKIIE